MRSTIGRVLRVVVLLAAAFSMVSVGLFPSTANGQDSTLPTVSASGNVSYAPGAGAVVIDPDLAITSATQTTVDGAVVSIGSGFTQNEDSLGISGQTDITGTVEGLEWNYDSERGQLILTGEASLDDYQTALRQVTFANSDSSLLDSDRSVLISLGSAVYNERNDHFYEFVFEPGIDWTEAKAAAEARSHAGRQGYLATITTDAESEFVITKLAGNGWIGASDDDVDKEWNWVTGPEAGTHFYTQLSDDEGCGEGPASEQPAGAFYTNWEIGDNEPNDFPSGCTDGENFGYIAPSGRWNDLADGAARTRGYIVEYGGVDGEPTEAPVVTILVQADVPSIAIELMWAGDDPELRTAFTISPEVEGCGDDRRISIAAGQASIDVPVHEVADGTPCVYAVTQAAPDGYSVSPEQVTGVAVEATASFTNTQASGDTTPDAMPDALPRTGTSNPVLAILGLTMSGAGALLIGGGRRRWVDRRRAKVISAAPAPQLATTFATAVGDTAPAITSAPPAVGDTAPAITSAPPVVAVSAASAPVASQPQTPPGENPLAVLDDLMRLIDDLAEN